MMSRAFSSLLILALLICPFRCLGAFCAETGAAAESVATCKCCHHAPVSEGSHSEDSPAPSEPDACDNCLCHGALRGDDSANGSWDVQQIVALPVDLLPLVTVSLPSVVLESAAENAEIPIVSGWMLRIRFESIVC